jgi:cellulose synthase/poly-beta-1,6-N-acetylglucosamine synthase-like glycosyltransferase
VDLESERGAMILLNIFVLGSLILSILLTIQSAYTLYLMLYTWDQPDAYQKAKAPSTFLPPNKSFTVMLPARHEEDVIQTTIERVVRSNYPTALLEVVVICKTDDDGTIAKAEEKIADLRSQGIDNVRVLTFSNQPTNKPHGLNVGLKATSHEIVTIFDSEDDIHPDIFNVINTVMLREGVNVVQSGVQLMNYETNWYSTLNVLEYFFWFKSRLHYHARTGMTPLGGNTVFFARRVLEAAGGWDEHNLTEDADVGIRISSMHEPVRIVYDDRYVTREETPPTLDHFIRQRTRWSQGFLQTLMKREWARLPHFEQRLLAIYTLAFPTIQAVLGLYVLVSVATIFTIKTPVLVAITLSLPLYLLLGHLLLSLVGLYEFSSAHQLKPAWKTPIVMTLTYLPYQWVLSYAAVRATIRELRGINNWEKTAHVGAHRLEAHPVGNTAAAKA